MGGRKKTLAHGAARELPALEKERGRVRVCTRVRACARKERDRETERERERVCVCVCERERERERERGARDERKHPENGGADRLPVAGTRQQAIHNEQHAARPSSPTDAAQGAANQPLLDWLDQAQRHRDRDRDTD